MAADSIFHVMRLIVLGFVAIIAAGAMRVPLAAAPQGPNPAPSGVAAPEAVFTQYCVTCHNARLKTAGVVIDPSELSEVSANAEVWEKVVRKLRSATMPPAGMPRPDQATYDRLAAFL
jgi:mono/diheme cytochrome c family protein